MELGSSWQAILQDADGFLDSWGLAAPEKNAGNTVRRISKHTLTPMITHRIPGPAKPHHRVYLYDA